MTEAAIVHGVIRREGGFVDHPADKGGPTKYGITAGTLGAWRMLGRRATADEVRALEVGEASEIYRRRYVEDPGFTSDAIAWEPLRVQLIDFGVNSGPARAVRWLQRVIGAPATGSLDGPTVAILREIDSVRVGFRPALALVNDALVAARLFMVDAWTDGDPAQKPFEEGVESRALEFFTARPESVMPGQVRA